MTRRPLEAGWSAAEVEHRATRLAEVALVLLGLAILLAGIQVRFIEDRRDDWWYATLVPVGGAVLFLFLAGVYAFRVDRIVGVPKQRAHERARAWLAGGVAALLVAGGFWVAMQAEAAGGAAHPSTLSRIQHFVVIYQENHSFDNLYGGWERVNGLANADVAHTRQIKRSGRPYKCLPQRDVNLRSPSPLPADGCSRVKPFNSHFANAPFEIDKFIPWTAKTCPQPSDPQWYSHTNGIRDGEGAEGGCTRDLVHSFYESQYQLNGGAQNRYVAGSNAAGLTMGYYNTTTLPIYVYLHRYGHPRYAILDAFFQAAFGGSFLNHQWLIAASSPICNRANGCPAEAKHSVLEANGFPRKSEELTQACHSRKPKTIGGLACGDHAVNTMAPAFAAPGTPAAHAPMLPPRTAPTIGKLLSEKGIDWAWYAGDWSKPDRTTLFQSHHQPFTYFAAFSTKTPDGKANRKAHLRDEDEFMQAASSTGSCNLKPVSFVKPTGEENEHPGYASEHKGSEHLVSLLTEIETSACRKDTMVIVTYDEFGGQWDHVPPPGQEGTPGPHDRWGPGPRIPALVISPFLKGDFVVDHTEHDTTSILATIEHRFGLKPLTRRTRDRIANDLSSVFAAT